MKGFLLGFSFVIFEVHGQVNGGESDQIQASDLLASSGDAREVYEPGRQIYHAAFHDSREM